MFFFFADPGSADECSRGEAENISGGWLFMSVLFFAEPLSFPVFFFSINHNPI